MALRECTPSRAGGRVRAMSMKEVASYSLVGRTYFLPAMKRKKAATPNRMTTTHCAGDVGCVLEMCVEPGACTHAQRGFHAAAGGDECQRRRLRGLLVIIFILCLIE